MTANFTWVLIVIAALALAWPALVSAQAQPPRPAVFGGSVTLNGKAPPNGTVVTAAIDGVLAASTSVSGGNYAFSIAQPPGSSFEGKTITFKVGASNASQTAIWTTDGGAELNLTAGTAGAPTPVVVSQGTVGVAGAAGPSGPRGAIGATGASGVAGPAGATGATGAAGAQGSTGPKGNAGPAGAAGPSGQRGAPGTDGVPGATGVPGQPGWAGPQGIPGSTSTPLFGIVALIVAIVAVAVSVGGVLMRR